MQTGVAGVLVGGRRIDRRGRRGRRTLRRDSPTRLSDNINAKDLRFDVLSEVEDVVYLRDVERLPHSKDAPQTHFALDDSRTAPIARILDPLKIVGHHRRLPRIAGTRDGHKGRFFASLARVRLELADGAAAGVARWP